MAKSRLHLVTKKMFKVPVEFKHEGSDALGLRLAHQIKEKIKNSRSLRLTNDYEEKLQVHFITENICSFDMSCWSLTFSVPNVLGIPMYIDSQTGYSRKHDLVKSIESIMAKIDLYVDILYRAGFFIINYRKRWA